MNINKSNWFLWALAALLLFNVIGAVVLAMQKESIKGATGDVWNTVDLCGQKLEDLSDQTKYMTDYYSDEVLDQITDARSAYKAAQESGDVDAMLEAVSDANVAINIVMENYPDVGIAGLNLGLFDETAGCYNRITYTRSNVIDIQESFNKNRILFMPVGLMFDREDILGERSDPSNVDLPSNFDQ